MHRLRQFLMPGSVAAAMASAVALYTIKQETRVVAAEVARLEQTIEARESELVLLKAELANRARPDRIAALARRHIGMKPLSPAQIGTIDKLAWREGVGADSKGADISQ